MPPAHPPSLIPVCTLQIVSFNIASLAQIATHQKACQVLMLCVARNPKRREIPWLIEILDFPEHLAKARTTNLSKKMSRKNRVLTKTPVFFNWFPKQQK